jgi:hypothetical protein
MSQSKTIHVPVTPGMREDLSPHAAPPGTLTIAENVRFPVAGEVESRRGTTALSVATSADVSYDDVITNDGPDFLQAVPGGFVFGAQGYGFRYDFGQSRAHAAGSYSDAVPHGRFATIAAEGASYADEDATPYPLSVAVGGGYVVIVWSGGYAAGNITASSIKVQVYTEGGTLVTTFTDDDHSAAWVVYDSVAAAFVLVMQGDASSGPTDIFAAVLTVASTGVTLGSLVDVATLNSSDDYWAACAWSGQGWALVHQSGATTITVQKLTGTTVVTGTPLTTGTATPVMSVYADTTHLYVGWVDVAADNTAKARVYDTSLSNTSGGDVTVYTDVGQTSITLTPPLFGPCVAASTAFVVIGRATSLCGASDASTYLIARRLDATGTLTTANSVTYNMLPASAPFNNGMVWCRMRTPNTSTNGNNYVRHVLLDFMADRLSTSESSYRLRFPRVALIGDAFADPSASNYAGGSYQMHLDTPKSLSNGHWIVGIPRLVRSELSTSGVPRGLALGEWLEFATDAPRDVRLMGAEAVVAGSPVLMSPAGSQGTLRYATASLSLPAAANQNQGMDLGFFVEAALDAGVQSAEAGSNLTLLGTYQFRAVIEWIDGLGRRWRGRPSRVVTVTLSGSNDAVTFTAADDYAWVRQVDGFVSGNPSDLRKVLYRTTAGGSTFYRVSVPQGGVAGAGGIILDKLNDTYAQTHEVLYTDGGVLDNDHPPSCRYIAVTEDRLWFGGLWDETQIQSSKILVPGEPPQFSDSPAFRVVLPDDCTGLAAQDGVLIAFCASAIYAVQGAGPTDQGQGDWGSPRVITRSTGCINSLSILETSAGIFFQSPRGIEMLPRGLGEPVFIGSPVQDTLGSATITSAAVIKSGTSSTARFCLGTTTVLVFDLETNAWSRDVYPAAVVAVTDTEDGAVLALKDVSNGYGFLLEGGATVNDSTGNGPTAVASVLQWADIRPFGIAGQGRFTGAIGLFDELTTGSSPGYQTANATLYVTVDRATDAGKGYDMGVMQSPDYRKHVPLNDAGTACVLKLTTAANGWRFMGWTVELEDLGGGRRMGETEQG